MSNEKGKQAERRHKKMKFKTAKRYRLSFYNENTLNCDWSVHMSRRKMIILIVAVLLTSSIVGAVIIAFTPLKNILPGYLRPTDRKEYVIASARIDSLLQIVADNDLYLNNVSAIMNGTLPADSLFCIPPETVSIPENTDSLLAPSEAETAYAEEYRLRDEFTLPEPATDNSTLPQFTAPVRDAVVTAGRSSTSTVFTFPDDKVTVFAIARGTIIDTDRKDNGTFTITIQHPDGYVSRYSGLTRLYRDRRQSIAAGSRIGAIDHASDGKSPKFSFELFHDGTPLRPTDYITF